MTFTSLQDAAKALLIESCQIANDSKMEYAVCGGWSPYLRNSSPISHPGTKDVDLLFSEACEMGALKEVVLLFTKNGFQHSAKHQFQLMRSMSVNRHEFVFNVDFLHPTETKMSPELFIDQFELPVFTDSRNTLRFSSKSIALPNSNFVFSGFVENEYVEAAGRSAEIPLIDETALLITKSKSYQIKKRQRDLFDAFLAITQPKNEHTFRESLKRLKMDDEDTFAVLDEFRKVFESSDSVESADYYEQSRQYFERENISKEQVHQVFYGFLQELREL